MTSRILFVSSDVFFWARIEGMARSAGVDAVRAADDAAMEAALLDGRFSRVIFDLGCRAVDPLAWGPRWKATSHPPQMIAFGSHVDTASLDAARNAGFDAVMANSQFNRSLREWIA